MKQQKLRFKFLTFLVIGLLGMAMIAYYLALGIFVRFGQSLMFLWLWGGIACILRALYWLRADRRKKRGFSRPPPSGGADRFPRCPPGRAGHRAEGRPAGAERAAGRPPVKINEPWRFS